MLLTLATAPPVISSDRYYQAWWRDWNDRTSSCDGQGVYISPADWTSPTAVGNEIEVVLTSCADSVALYLNGIRQGPSGAGTKMERYSFVTQEQLFFSFLLHVWCNWSANIGAIDDNNHCDIEPCLHTCR
jgi:hypothetical protein